MPTGVPPGLSAYLESVAREGQLNRPDHSTAADPYAGMRYTVALEVAAARAMREAYIRALYDGPSPAEWLREAHNLNHDGHYLARMSDDGLATTMCALWWWRPNIDAQESGSDTAVGYLYPVELVAALAVGFAYPIPKAGSAEWERQAREEADLDGVFACELLNHTTADLAELLADGVPPWDAGGCKGGAA
jgi:hypothetical protein